MKWQKLRKRLIIWWLLKKSREKIVLRAIFFLFGEISIGGSTEILTSSREIAIRYKKRHNSVLRTIGRITKKNPELSRYFTKSSYISKDGRCLKQYEMDDMGADILKNRFKYDVRSARFEYKYLNEIRDFLNLMNIDSVEQYQVDNYRIDLYIPKYNTAIEIDEVEHKYKREYDLTRQNYIENKIHCKFIRINEGESCGCALARIMKELYKSA